VLEIIDYRLSFPIFARNLPATSRRFFRNNNYTSHFLKFQAIFAKINKKIKICLEIAR